MATKEEKRRLSEGPRKGQLAAHEAEKELRAHDPAIDDPAAVPPVIETHEDGTPGFIKYGAAVLLGLAFGYGCYVWYSGRAQAPYEGSGLTAVATEEYFANVQPFGESAYPDPFVSPYEPGLDAFEATEVDVDGVPVAGEIDAVAEQPITQAAPAADTRAAADTQAAADAASGVNTVVYLFETDGSSVPETPQLTALAEKAKKTGATLDIEAYTDTHGRTAYNQKLSERRAAAIRDYLTAHGVAADKIISHGNGPTDDAPDDLHNRRAEVSLVR